MTPPLCSFTRDELAYRGIPIADVVGKETFTTFVPFFLTGRADYRKNKAALLDALLLAWLDHGEPPPSTQAAALAASCGVGFIPALCAAFQCWGAAHAPVEAAAALLYGPQAGIKGRIAAGEKLPGYGHPVHGNDPRVNPLLRVALELQIAGEYFKRAGDIEALLAQMHKRAKINLAGLTAALWLDMGFTPGTVGLVAALGRAVGLAAHYDAARNGKQFRGTT